LRLEAIQVAHEFGHRRLVVLFERKFEKLTRVAQARRKLIQHLYDLFELRSLLSQGLGTLRFVPDVRLFQFASDLGQALCFAFVVKDTPSTPVRSLRSVIVFLIWLVSMAVPAPKKARS